MLTLFNIVTGFSVLALLSTLIAGFTIGLLAGNRDWPNKRVQTASRGLAVALVRGWWVIAVYGLRMDDPLDWIAATIGTPVRVLALLAWPFSIRTMAPLIARRITTSH